MKEKLMAQVSILERAAKDESVEVDLDAARTVMFEATQKIELLEKDITERDAKVLELTPLAEIGTQRIAESKAETLRLLTAICEHSESKDMGKVERMKERFEKENLDFAAIKRYEADAQAEFDVIFPPEGRSKGKETETTTGERTTVEVVSAYKFSSK